RDCSSSRTCIASLKVSNCLSAACASSRASIVSAASHCTMMSSRRSARIVSSHVFTCSGLSSVIRLFLRLDQLHRGGPCNLRFGDFRLQLLGPILELQFGVDLVLVERRAK